MGATRNGDTLEFMEFNEKPENFSGLMEHAKETAWLDMQSSLQYVQDVCFGSNLVSGWWQDAASGMDLLEIIHRPQTRVEELLGMALVSQKIMLAVSELGEAMEGHRRNRMDDKLPHRKMLEVEIADAIIRLFDLAGGLGLHMDEAIPEKLKFNLHREDHKLDNRAKDGGKAY